MIKLSPKVGIIIPAYNTEKYIFRALESCINQSYENIEIIVVDDGSSDGTYNVINHYCGMDSRIKLYRQENHGVSSARNMAMKKCSADYILFLDSDDWLEMNTVEKLIQYIDYSQPHYNLISAACYYVNMDGSGEFKKVISDDETPTISMCSDEALMYVGERKYNLRSSCYKLFSMTVIRDNDISFAEDIKHGEDGLFVFEYLRKVDRFIYSPDPLWNILRRAGSTSRSPYTSDKMSAVVAVERMLAYENSEALSRELRKYYVRRILTILGDAILTGIDSEKDIFLLRRKLRQQCWIYMMLQKNFKLKLIYILETFGPTKLVNFILSKRNNRL